MPAVTFVQPDGRRMTVEATPGDSVMETAMAHGIDGIVAECGGSAVCGTCHVFVDEADLECLPAPGALEDDLLNMTAVARRANSRLSCQLFVPAARGLTVHLPDHQT
jgi:2Fe-2S ferredoxin